MRPPGCASRRSRLARRRQRPHPGPARRYAQLFADGLPLYGAGGDSLNLLQVPPLDPGQVEVIKGAASALYGPAALGGIINLVSRQPREAETEALVNVTPSRGSTAPSGWPRPRVAAGAGRCSPGSTGTPSGPRRRRLVGSAVLRPRRRPPRVRFQSDRGAALFVTGGAIVERREGGTEPGAVAPTARRSRRGWTRCAPTPASSGAGWPARASSPCAAPTPATASAARSATTSSAARPHRVRRGVAHVSPPARTPSSSARPCSRIASPRATSSASTTRSPCRRSSRRTRWPSARTPRSQPAPASTCIASTGPSSARACRCC